MTDKKTIQLTDEEIDTVTRAIYDRINKLIDGTGDYNPYEYGEEEIKVLQRAADILNWGNEVVDEAMEEPDWDPNPEPFGDEDPRYCPLCDEVIDHGQAEFRLCDLDPGDPEVGPQPNVGWFLVHKKCPEPVCECEDGVPCRMHPRKY